MSVFSPPILVASNLSEPIVKCRNHAGSIKTSKHQRKRDQDQTNRDQYLNRGKRDTGVFVFYDIQIHKVNDVKNCPNYPVRILRKSIM